MIMSGAGRWAVAALSLGVLAGAEGAAAEPRDPLAPVWAAGLKADSGFNALVAPDAGHVWAFGVTSPEAGDRPLVHRRAGAGWKRAALPRGLRGQVELADASGPDNVWAVGDDPYHPRGGTYLLRWDGKRWTVARRWNARTVSAVVATGARGVWVFDRTRRRALRFDGRRWREVKTPVAVWSAAGRGGKLWAWGMDGKKPKVVRFDGRRWRTAHPGGILPKPTAKSFTSCGTPAFARDGVWLVCTHLRDWSAANPRAEVFLLRRAGGAWHREPLDPAVPVDAEPVPDGKGGLWFLATRDASAQDGPVADDLLLTHRAADGHWSARLLGRAVAGDPEVADFVRLPGAGRLLGAGSVGGRGAAVFDLH